MSPVTGAYNWAAMPYAWSVSGNSAISSSSARAAAAESPDARAD